MLSIRLRRGGVKKCPFYFVVVIEKRSSRDGMFVEKVGFFNPGEKNILKSVVLSTDRILYWVSKGAKMSSRVSNLFKVMLRKNLLTRGLC